VYSENEDVDMDVANGRRVTRREKSLAETVGKIYCAVHGHSVTCPHENWKKQATEQYCEYVKQDK
jgi:hypothetical protein